jgi:hexulose-6-phosphate isomerase
MIILPLVDNGCLETSEKEDSLVKFLLQSEDFLETNNLQILFECDYSPENLLQFIERFPKIRFGINYDIGNSAAYGFNPREELLAYGDRIKSVHVKDRLRGGGTVPLGTGDADFCTVFACLFMKEYCGNFILQTARAENGDHLGVIRQFRDLTQHWIENFKLLNRKKYGLTEVR